MPIIARKKQSNFKPAPEGLHQAVCCDVWEPWTEPNPFNDGKPVEKTRIVWQLDMIDQEYSRPFEVSQIYTLSLHEKSKLCQHLESWRGKRFTQDEKNGFDLETLIGVNAQVQVVHSIKDSGEVYANVQAIVPVGKSMTKLRVTEGFTRKRDRIAKHEAEQQPSDEEVPF